MKSILLVAWFASGIAGLAAPAVGQVTDDQVQAAIDKGVKYLLDRQKPNGLFADSLEFPWNPAGGVIYGGEDCWVMVGLAIGGVNPKGEAITKGLDAIMRLELKQTYAVAARLIALSRLYHKVGRERQELLKVVILKDLKWLYEAQGAEGQWDYNSLGGRSSGHWDFSNTQMAILAFSEAAMAGFELPEQTLMKTQKLYLQYQTREGGWSYGSRPLGGNIRVDQPYCPMTAAAVASLYITRDYLYRGLGCPCSNGRSRLRPNEVDRAIQRGVDWLGENYEPKGGMYWHYSCERVGLAAGLKYFGSHNWYAEGSAYILRGQAADGSWRGPGGYQLSDTVFAICFLVKGRAPILVNKLQFDGQWDNHPRDAANLVQYVSAQKEQPIQWQVINLDAPVDEWHDAPILYLSAETAVPLTDEHKAKLRRFTDSGGTVLFEASCGNRQIGAWWERTCREIWPEWELKALDRDHPVYESDQKIVKRLPGLFHMFDGVRSMIFFARADLSCPWNTMAVAQRRELFDLGTNLYAYATDRRPLRARLAQRTSTDKKYSGAITIGPRNKLTVARVKHGGDYTVGRNYEPLEVLAASVRGAGLGLADAGEKSPMELKADEVQVAYLTGRQGLTMAEDQIAALKEYLRAGGFLFAEAALGDKRFDEAFRRFAAQTGLELLGISGEQGIVTGAMGAAKGHATKNVRVKPTLIQEGVIPQAPLLVGIYLDGKMVGVYSPYDCMYAQTGCEAWGCRGYQESDARAILTNIFLLASSH